MVWMNLGICPEAAAIRAAATAAWISCFGIIGTSLKVISVGIGFARNGGEKF